MAQCYLCGTNIIKNKNKSRDHVPPECIFPPQNKPLNLITVPCCKSCNNNYKMLAEKMRNFLAILAIQKSDEVGKIVKREVLKSCNFKQQFLSYTKKHPNLIYDNGNPLLYFFFKDNELEQRLIRIVKGIFFYLNKKRINDDVVFKIKKHPELIPQSSNTFPMENGLQFRPYFVYKVINVDTITDFWLFIFYDCLMFSVTVEKHFI